MTSSGQDAGEAIRRVRTAEADTSRAALPEDDRAERPLLLGALLP